MEKETLQIKRIYKDSVFRMLFKEKEELLSLYNAIYGTEHKDPDQLEIALELKVIQLNINPGYNEAIVSKCPVLFEYIKFVSCVRKYQQMMPVAEAVDQAVKECISRGILETFLRNNRAEVVKMSIYEYDEEKHMRTLREEGREEGIKQGIEQGIERGKDQMLYRMFHNNRTPQEISEFTGESLEYLRQVHEKYLEMVQEESRYDVYFSVYLACVNFV